MKRSTKKKRTNKPKRIQKTKCMRIYGGKHRPIKEQLWANIQAPHASKWPVIKIYSTTTGRYNDILSKYFGDNIHKVEYAISSIMHYENIYGLGLTRSFFQELVWLGQELPEELNPNKDEKSPDVKEREAKQLAEIHADPNYKKELDSWLEWLNTYIMTPMDNGVPVTSDQLLNMLKSPSSFEKMDKNLLDIAKLARISLYKNYKLNRSGIPISNPHTIEAIENPVKNG